MKRIILIIFLLSGCSFNQVDITNNLSEKSFSGNLSFEEFKTKLIEYSINSPYPNIDI